MKIDVLLQDLRWSKALYINEKIKYYDLQKCSADNCDENIVKWLRLFKNNKEILYHRIQDYKLNTTQFEKITQNENFNCDYNKMKWHAELSKIFTEENNFHINSFTKIDKDEIPFFEFLVPFLKRSIRVIKNELDTFSEKIDINKIMEIGIKMLSDCISSLSITTLIFELNKSKANNELKGSTTYERYRSFVDLKLKNNYDILKLLLKYPVMTRLITESSISITNNLIYAVKKFIKDKFEIENYFKIYIKEIDSISYMGDFHNNKKCVMKFKFNSGYQLLYKPRDLSIDKEFQNLLIWFNEKGINKKFKTFKILNKKEYGWEEYLPYKQCEDKKQLRNFFERQGQYLSLMYILNAGDMHFENIIANGQYPMFIDLESLFKNQPLYIDDQLRNKGNRLEDSVLKTAMLPIKDEHCLYKNDISGIAGDIKQNIRIFKIVNKNTDKITIIKDSLEEAIGRHLPKLDNEYVTPKVYIDDIKRGFINCYHKIFENKKIFIELIRKLFIGKSVRIILRPTIVYQTLLKLSTNYKYFKSGIERSYLMDYMWCILNKEPKRIKTIQYEIHDLLRGDVPFFSYKIGESNLIHTNTNSKITDCFEKDVILKIIDKIKSMNTKILNNQCNIIEKSLKEKYYLA